MTAVARIWTAKLAERVGVVARPNDVTVVPLPGGVLVKVGRPGIDGIEGGLESWTVMPTLARCLLQLTNSCWPVGWYVVPSFDFRVTVKASAFQPSTWAAVSALNAELNACSWLRTSFCAGERGWVGML